MSMELTVVGKGLLCDTNYNDVKETLVIGETVKYKAHLPGGNVKIEKAGVEYIAHPACFKELRS